LSQHDIPARPVLAEPRTFASGEGRPPGVASSVRLITARQIQCLAWVQEGKSATDIGGILGLSGRTVEKHLLKLCAHLGVRTRFQAVLRARDLGLFDEHRP